MNSQAMSRFTFGGLLMLCVTVVCLSANAHSDDDSRDRHKVNKETPSPLADRNSARDKYKGKLAPPSEHYRYDQRYNHNRYYPRPGYAIKALSNRHYKTHFHNRYYYYDSGVWFRSGGIGFEVVIPPVGIYVPVLPPYYTTIWAGSYPYYYADDVYYRWRPDRNTYQVVEPPASIVNQPQPLLADELYVYPQNGQTDEQLADDRYACHAWSRDQTGYDPSQPPSDLSVTQLSDKREAYQRASRACLEGRGYSVR